MSLHIIVFVAVLITVSNAFLIKNTQSSHGSSSVRLNAKILLSKVGEIKNGERKIIDINDKAATVILTNMNGNYYAVNAKCPHLGLPMKTGEIEVGDNGVPTITCKFHNSKFQLNDGTCTEWCTGVLGIKNTGFFGDIMSNVGGERNTPAKTYTVMIENNNIFIDA